MEGEEAKAEDEGVESRRMKRKGKMENQRWMKVRSQEEVWRKEMPGGAAGGQELDNQGRFVC